MSFSIRLTEEEKALATSYAKLNGISIAEAFKRSLFEKIEDEYDAMIADRECAAYEKDKQSRPFEELLKELDL